MPAPCGRTVPTGPLTVLVRLAVPGILVVVLGGCMVGPDYRRPPAPTADAWRWTAREGVASREAEAAGWWHAFGDPALDALVEAAYRANPTLLAAGLRVVQARARRGIAIGGLFPQTQAARASYTRTHPSKQEGIPPEVFRTDAYELGFDAAWEIDLWGRFRRSIEASDAELLAAVADYDDVLTSLVGEVAATYVQIRVLDGRLALARDNVRVQSESLEIARVRFEAGGTSALDVEQATTLLASTQATIPEFQIQRRRALDSLSVLLGMPPSALDETLLPANGIPTAPVEVAVGIPADLLRRRPDVRRAERQMAAQSARIGVAKADLFPRLTLSGSVGLSADDAANLLTGRAFTASTGPRIDWPVLNYGRLISAVRVQDAAFQELVALWADTVLRAQQEVEDALVGYVRGTEKVVFLDRSVAAANRAVDLSLIQYREGAADYTRVLTTQQSKLLEDDRLVTSRGDVTLSVVSLYKALGGGWELRNGGGFVPEPVRDEMRDRTWYGGVLDEEAEAEDVREAADGTEGSRRPGFLRWRWWRPRWW
jgi:NodT family efflux transporter outer membrane factor (OMF) lipoprotein